MLLLAMHGTLLSTRYASAAFADAAAAARPARYG
jgi:hypothetical protein